MGDRRVRIRDPKDANIVHWGRIRSGVTTAGTRDDYAYILFCLSEAQHIPFLGEGPEETTDDVTCLACLAYAAFL